jgi:hypothetical protein
MTNTEAARRLGLETLCPGAEREVSGGYAGDLLSWVMGRAGKDCAWITIMSNANVAAVAVMAEISMVILAEGVRPDPELLRRAELEGVALYSSPLSAYELCWRLHEALL